MPTKEQLKETLISFSEDKGYLFWAFVYVAVIWMTALFQQIFGSGVIWDYITEHEFRFIFLAFFTGSIADYLVKANVEVSAVRNKYIFKPPLYLRRFRGWTNTFFILGLALSTYIQIRWPGYVGILPTFTFITSFMLCTIWAL
ncbi:MAG: hypothetical protein HN757_14010, partial [Calditrichaeota bacterium]|nr:hypothetical protein [Calditrichota bacterium]